LPSILQSVPVQSSNACNLTLITHPVTCVMNAV